jgi:predicted ATPase/DNA-binding winged helix-turn-helix (wHTH) protein
MGNGDTESIRSASVESDEPATPGKPVEPMHAVLTFGPFRLTPGRRELLENGTPVRLGSRAFDILVALVEQAGNVLSNMELMARVWHKTVVEPGALRVHMAGLRKVLGDGRAGHRYIINVPLQGYCFVAPVSRSNEQPSTVAQVRYGPAQDPAAPVHTVVASPTALPLPSQITRLIGREDVVAELVEQLPRQRCITLVGPGGMGKTTVALAAARTLVEASGQQAIFVNLAPLTDPGLVIGSLISALGIPSLVTDPVRGLLAYLRERAMLIVLDNCEHLIQAAADLAEALLIGAPRVHILVTSREPLRIQGEWVHRLTSLRVPPALAKLSPQEMLHFSSAELFVERVRAVLDNFELTDVNVPVVVEICRALDGIPLAIELAAAGVERLGVRGVAANLGNRLSLLTRGRRTALPRHQTLRAALDWGYALLAPGEQTLLQRLAIFRGRFTSDSARAIVKDLPSVDVDDDLFNLVSKSLVASDISEEVVQYWLLETTREYALSRLEASGDLDEVARLHADHMHELADAADDARARLSMMDWRARFAHLIDDLRGALTWGLSPSGDTLLAATVAAASAPIWFALSRMAEYLTLIERAMAGLGEDRRLDPSREMAMLESYGHALWHIRGTGPEATTAFGRALDLAERAGSRPDRLRIIWGLWLITNSTGDYAATNRLAERFGEIAAGTDDSGNEVAHHRMMTMSLHFVGQHAKARMHALRVLEQPLTANVSALNSGFQFDQCVAALTSLARIEWVLGHPEQALRHAEQAVSRALEINHCLSLCFALSIGCTPVAFWCGDWERATRYTRLLQERSKEYSLSFWQHFAYGFEMVLRRRQGEGGSIASLQHASRSLQDTLCTLDPDLADEAGLARGESGEVGWSAPELLRIKGERLLAAGDVKAAKVTFHKAFKLAQSHEALSWELRCAISLARLMVAQASAGEARACLEPVLERFTEGFDSEDLRQAFALLQRLK